MPEAIPNRSVPRFSRAWLMLVGLLGLVPHVNAADAADVSKEYQIKAAFVYNFTKFVEWPATRFAETDSPIVIGVLGENPFGGELDKMVQGRKVHGRAIVVRRVVSIEEGKFDAAKIFCFEPMNHGRHCAAGTSGKAKELHQLQPTGCQADRRRVSCF